MLLIYGAYGYTGTLIVEECVRRGIRPIVAGRDPEALRDIATRYDLEMRVAALFAGRGGSDSQSGLTPPGSPPPAKASSSSEAPGRRAAGPSDRTVASYPCHAPGGPARSPSATSRDVR